MFYYLLLKTNRQKLLPPIGAAALELNIKVPPFSRPDSQDKKKERNYDKPVKLPAGYHLRSAAQLLNCT
jgi:hypothetical protein